MASADNLQKNSPAPVALPGLGRALISAGKVSQQAAEIAAKKAASNRTAFIAELSASGEITALEIAETISTMFSTPLLDLSAVDPQQLPSDLLDPKICSTYQVLALGKRSNRLTVATADPTQQEAAEQIKFTTQLFVDWVVVESDKLQKLIEQAGKSVSESLES